MYRCCFIFKKNKKLAAKEAKNLILDFKIGTI